MVPETKATRVELGLRAVSPLVVVAALIALSSVGAVSQEKGAPEISVPRANTTPAPSSEAAQKATPRPSDTPQEVADRLAAEAAQAFRRASAAHERQDRQSVPLVNWTPDMRVEWRSLYESVLGDGRIALDRHNAIIRDYPNTKQATDLKSGGQILGLSVTGVRAKLVEFETHRARVEKMFQLLDEATKVTAVGTNTGQEGLSSQEVSSRLSLEARLAFDRAEAAVKRGGDLWPEGQRGTALPAERQSELREISRETLRERFAALDKLRVIIRDYPESDHAVTLIGRGEVEGLSIHGLEEKVQTDLMWAIQQEEEFQR